MNGLDGVPGNSSTQTGSLDQSISRGTRWLLVGRLLAQVISLVVLAILYRSVPQEEFGRYGMVLPIILLLRVFVSFGLNAAVIQTSSLSNEQVSGLFWANALAGVIVTGVTLLIAPVLGWVFQTDVVIPVVLALSATAMLYGLMVQHVALLERKLAMSRMVAAQIGSQIAAGMLAVPIAWSGAGVWALVAQHYAELVVLLGLVWRMETWRPLPWRQCSDLGQLIRFGGFHSLGGLMNSLYLAADKLVLAVLIGGTTDGRVAIGLYSQAFNVMSRPLQWLVGPISSIMLPSLARSKPAVEKSNQWVKDFLRFVAIALLPISIGCLVTAQDVMITLGGAPWAPAGRVLTCLSIGMLGLAAIRLASVVMTARGQVKQMFRWEALTAVAVLLGCWAGHQAGGWWNQSTLGVAMAYSIVVTFVVAVPYLGWAMHTSGISLGEWARSLWRPTCAAIGMGLVVRSLQPSLALEWPERPLLRLATSALIGVVIYALLAWEDIRDIQHKFF